MMERRAWVVADTVLTGRKDIFCLTEPEQHHIGTLISGSRTNLDRFEQQVALIRRSPEMLSILRRLVHETRSIKFSQNNIAGIAQDALKILKEIEAPYREG